MGMRLGALVGLGCVVACAVACEGIAHVSAFSIQAVSSEGGAAGPYAGVCNACPPGSADVRRPPCPVDSDAPDDGQFRTYVWQRIHLGATPDQWRLPGGASYAVGMDQDCSTHPGTLPVECTPRTLDAGAAPVPWEPLPHGIDNSFSQRILWPVAQIAQALGKPVDLEAIINQRFASGNGSVLVNVFEWNGTPNDPQVGVVLCSTVGVSQGNGPPRWDGTDRWTAYAAGPDPEFPQANVPLTDEKTRKAYVANGVLFADYRDLGGAQLTILNNGARVTVILNDFYFTGQITDTTLTETTGVGRWYLDDFERATPDSADYLSGCDPTARAVLKQQLPQLGYWAADLAVDPSRGPDAPCDAISTAYQGDGIRATIGGYEPVQSVPGGCPP